MGTRTSRGNAEVAFRGDILKAWERAAAELQTALDRIDELEALARELKAENERLKLQLNVRHNK